MVESNQSFTKSEDEYTGNVPIVEGSTIYRKIKLRKGHLELYTNKFGGSHRRINGNIKYAEKLDDPDNSFSEYRIYIEDRQEPFILLACKKRKVS